MRIRVACARRTLRATCVTVSASMALLCLPLLFGTPARAQWNDSYEQPGNGGSYQAPPRRRARDAYYRDDGGYGRQPRYAPQQEAPRQFFWPWEERPQQAAPQAQPSYRAPRPRSTPSYADSQRTAPAVKRRVRAARLPDPVKPAVAKTEPSVQIAVFGDSLADHLARGLDDAFEDNSDVAVVDRAKGDSGLVRRDVVDWPKAADAAWRFMRG